MSTVETDLDALWSQSDDDTPDPKRRWQAAMERMEAMTSADWERAIYSDGEIEKMHEELNLLTAEYPTESWLWTLERWATHPGYARLFPWYRQAVAGEENPNNAVR